MSETRTRSAISSPFRPSEAVARIEAASRRPLLVDGPAAAWAKIAAVDADDAVRMAAVADGSSGL